MTRVFKFRWIPFVAAVAAAALGISLGNWQARRAQEKQAIAAAMAERQSKPPVVIEALLPAPSEAEFRKVRLRGSFVAGWPVYLDNRPHLNVAGFYLLMPFKVADTGRYVLVERGWFPRDPADRNRMPAIPTPQGPLTLDGTVRRAPGRLMQLGDAPAPRPGAVLQNVTVQEIAEASGLPMYPFVIEQTSDTRDGLSRDWPRPDAGIDMHRGYAFQWYGLAATALLFFLITGWKRESD
ncbi:MAG: SURF1 family protein [Burkholderiaceae bacterium]